MKASRVGEPLARVPLRITRAAEIGAARREGAAWGFSEADVEVRIETIRARHAAEDAR